MIVPQQRNGIAIEGPARPFVFSTLLAAAFCSWVGSGMAGTQLSFRSVVGYWQARSSDCDVSLWCGRPLRTSLASPLTASNPNYACSVARGLVPTS